MTISRRDLVWLGAGLAAGSGALAWWRRPPGIAKSTPLVGPSPTQQRYGHAAMPPDGMGPLSLDGVTNPPPPDVRSAPTTRTYAMDVVEHRAPVSVEHSVDAWTFNGSMPGPVLRATEGDLIEVRLQNRTTRAHNLHFHGRHEVDADGWEPVPPGGETTYRFTAGPFGVHPYHCDFTPIEDHIGSGLYGILIVDPPRERPPAREFALVLGGFDTDGDGRPDLFGWNGVAGFFAKYPIKVTAGELVRVYLANMATTEPMASFHLHAETFDVYRSGTTLRPQERTDLLTLGPAERAILEFRLTSRGRYMFHPHQTEMAEHGAMGWFAAT